MQVQRQFIATIAFCASCFMAQAQVTLESDGDIIAQGSSPSLILKDASGNNAGIITSFLGGFAIENPVTGPTGLLQLLTENGNLTIENQGNIGINIGNPDTELHILGNSEANPSLKVQIGNMVNQSNNAPGMFLQKIDGSFGGFIIADAANESSGSNGGIDLELSADDDISLITSGFVRLFVNNQGNVGIGTETPDQRLSVNGGASKVGGGTWSTFSDQNLKTDIRDFEDGLDQILQIRPVWYRYNGKANLPTEKEYVGVIAQEIQQIAPYTVESVPLQKDDDSESFTEYLSYNSTAVIYMLVNAVQEQQKEIEEKNARLDELENQVINLNRRLDQLEALITEQSDEGIQVNLHGSDQPKLEQNLPNPFNDQTQIRYYLPEGTQRAQLRITAANGQVIKTVELASTGQGQVNLNTNDLASGTYQYSLLVDGQLVTTKQMMVVK